MELTGEELVKLIFLIKGCEMRALVTSATSSDWW